MSSSALGPFLSARRAALSPEEAGIHRSGVRRVPGLRREEVALRAGLSVDYYARLEQGRERHPSTSVLEALSRALRLEPDAREHLFRLAGAAPQEAARPSTDRVEPALLALMDAWPGTPAFVVNRRLDVIAANVLARALYSPFQPAENLARMTFLDPAATTVFDDWQRSAESSVGSLRLALGFDPYDPGTLALVSELRDRSPQFRRLWERNDPRGKAREPKTFHHPDVGLLTLEHHTFDVRSAPGQQLIVYAAEPGSASDQGLRLLGALAASAAAPQRR